VTDAAEFGRVVLIVAVGFAVAILSSRISGRLRVPAAWTSACNGSASRCGRS
jgi:hypothetical protein